MGAQSIRLHHTRDLTHRVHSVPYMRVRKVGWTAKILAMSRDDALLEAFAAELKARRAALKLSQEELAHRAEINRTYIAKLELAQNQPTLCVLHQLALALNEELPEILQAVLIRYKRVKPAPATSGARTTRQPRK